MDEDVKETCMKELHFQVLDQDEKVTAVQLSNTWSIPLTEAIFRLETFVKKNVDQGLQTEFLVRGVSKGSTAVVTIVPETRVKAYANKLDSFTKSIFSVSKKRSSFAPQTFKLEDPQVINLPLDCGSRPVIVHVIPDARPAMEKDKKKNIFAAPGNSKKAEDVKKPALESKSTPQEETPQKKASSPTKGKASSVTKSSAEKSAKGKPVAKPQLGKGSIASFFGQKSGVSPPTEKKTEAEKESPKSEPVKMELEEAKEQQKPKSAKKVLKVEPESPKAPPPPPKSKDTPATDESSRKRNLSSDRGSDEKKKKNKSSPEEPSSKKAKKEVKTKKVEKRSRIMAICDSDSSEDEETAAKQPQVVSDDEEAPAVSVKPKKAAKEAEKKASPDENRNPANKKRKATRKVTKSYQDEDGFIRTVRETEEYSCSEEEEPVARKLEATADTKPEAASSSTLKQKAPTKQGSIMSFFGKK